MTDRHRGSGIAPLFIFFMIFFSSSVWSEGGISWNFEAAEGVSESWADGLTEAGIVPLCGFEHGLRAIAHAGATAPTGDWRPYAARPAPASRRMLDEAESKVLLGKAGVSVPRGITADKAADLAGAAAGLARDR